ncbi:MAG: nitrogenase [Spirochaetaceae bacterium]|nr:MAG: nitrogenase [Spirochaetaceae bacterium]
MTPIHVTNATTTSEPVRPLKISKPGRAPVTHNACTVCLPLGVSLAFRGVENAVVILHGSQGCATYIRRYLISHFKEPVDIASSSFTEASAVFGGAQNLKTAIDNVRTGYQPAIIAIGSTCLADTIGEDVSMIVRQYLKEHEGETDLPLFVPLPMPNSRGTHIDGLHQACRAAVEYLSLGPEDEAQAPVESVHEELKAPVGIFPGLVSPADIRYLKELVRDCGLRPVVLPDLSETMEGGLWDRYEPIPKGGTTPTEFAALREALGTVEFSTTVRKDCSAAELLQDRLGTPLLRMPLPVGIAATDLFIGTLTAWSGTEIDHAHQRERDRLIDAYADGHKYLSGLRVAVFGEEDLVLGLSGFLKEVGMEVVIAGTGGRTSQLAAEMQRLYGAGPEILLEDTDFEALREVVAEAQPDMLIGNSKGYSLSRALSIPLVRVGFPIHDRFGAARVQVCGYRGTQMLFDRIVNTVIEERQAESIGYPYM